MRYGEKALRELCTNQRIVVVREQCQLIEWTVRGRHPVAAGLIERELKATFHPHGVGLNVYPLPLPGLVAANPGSNSIVLVNKAPIPTRDECLSTGFCRQKGQAAMVEVKENSLRNDVRSPSRIDCPSRERAS